MNKGRLEAFSDGVLAIIITIMVLELKVPPHATSLSDLRPLLPVFVSYIISFLYIGIYWNNHHHLLHSIEHVSAGIMWTNLHLLFWLSLVPFVTAWMGENNFSPTPTALYGCVLLLAATSYWLLARAIVCSHGGDSIAGRAIGRDFKGNVSLLIYVIAIPCAFLNTWLAGGLYALVAMIWLVPDPRLEREMARTTPVGPIDKV